MKHASRVALVLALALVNLGLAPAAADLRSDPDVVLAQKVIPRFKRVDEGLFRGGQPDRKGFNALRQLGVRTVVNLRSEHDERAIVEGAGMKYVHIPISPSPFGVTTRFPDAAMRAVFEVIDDPDNGPVFVHCRRGADRTGVVVGFYRITRQQWDGEAAYREARKIGMQWWYRGFRAQLFELAQPREARTPALLPSLPQV